MRDIAKRLIRLAAVLAVSPILLIYFILKPFSGTDALLMGFGQFMSLFPGKVGSFLRIAFYRFTLEHCGEDSVIYFGTLFSQVGTSIGKGVYIGAQCNVGLCDIGDNVLFGSGVHIMSGKKQHGFADTDTRIQDQPGQYTKISIGEDSWIGNGALVMANVGAKCIVGAGSVVSDDVPDYSIVAGNPARIIKSRERVD